MISRARAEVRVHFSQTAPIARQLFRIVMLSQSARISGNPEWMVADNPDDRGTGKFREGYRFIAAYPNP